MTGSSFHPSREDGEVEVQADEHVDVPHVAGDEAEGVRDAKHIGHAIAEGLTIGFCPTEELDDDAAIHPQQTGEPWCEIVEDRPYQEREEYTRDAFLVERFHVVLDG